MKRLVREFAERFFRSLCRSNDGSAGFKSQHLQPAPQSAITELLTQ